MTQAIDPEIEKLTQIMRAGAFQIRTGDGVNITVVAGTVLAIHIDGERPEYSPSISIENRRPAHGHD